MKIFLITHTFSTIGAGGGGEVFVYNFVKELAGRGHKVCVFTTSTRRNPEKEKELGIKVFSAPSFGHHALHKFEYVLFWKQALKAAQEFNPDIIHAQNDVLPALIGEKIKNRLHKPFVLGIEYLSEKNVSLNMKLTFALNKLLLPKIDADAIACWSDYVIEKFLIPWKIPKQKIKKITGAIDTEKYNPKNSGKDITKEFGKNLIVSAKPLHKTNALGIAETIKAMKFVVKKHPDYKYLVFGNGESRQMLEQLVKKLSLEKNILFPGSLTPEKVPEAYAAADILVHSFAFKATTSVALMESMAAGKAIVATDTGEVANTLKGSGELVKAKNPASIARGINKLIESPALRKQLGKKARQTAEENYSIKRIADEFEELYSQFLKK